MLLDEKPYHYIAAIGIIVLMHIFYLPLSKRIERFWPHWYTAAGGFAVGYIFLLLLPKLTLVGNKGMAKLPNFPLLGLSFIYLFVLLGFVFYWIIDVLSNDHRRDIVYWRRIQSSSFFFYSILIGEVIANFHYIPIIFALSVASLIFHLAGMNHLFHHWHPKYFQYRMRWLMTIGTILGAFLGYLNFFSQAVIGLLTAFMGGAILINVIFYEMPKGDNAKPLPFLLGIIAFTVIIISANAATPYIN